MIFGVTSSLMIIYTHHKIQHIIIIQYSDNVIMYDDVKIYINILFI